MRTPRTLRALTFAVALAAAAAASLADDFWLQPSSFRPKAGDEISISLLAGPRLAGKDLPRDDARILQFTAQSLGNVVDVAGKTGDRPAGRVTLLEDGTWVVGFRSKPAAATMEPRKFEEYLRAYGLGHVIDERARLGETEAKGREIYSRCAKALLCVGRGERGGHDEAAEFPCELFPGANPYRSAAGVEMPFRLTLDGKPAAGVLVRARAAAKADEPVEARTDDEGRVKLRLAHAGVWLVEAVVMRRSDPEKTFAEWESLWASVTFDLPAEAPAAAPAAAPGVAPGEASPPPKAPAPKDDSKPAAPR